MKGGVLVAVGTRPEAIKMGPVLRALHHRGVPCSLMLTGQHPDLDLRGCGVMTPADLHLPVLPNGLGADDMCDRIEAFAGPALRAVGPSLVLVQGDTNSALAVAEAAAALGIPIGHIEAGLRTHDTRDPWPEERNRVAIDGVAALLFAPTAAACANLRAERATGRMYLTGNSGVDALVETAGEPGVIGADERPLLLVTMHRRENRGAGVSALGKALRRIAASAEVRFAAILHPNPAAAAEMTAALTNVPGCTLLPPQCYAGTVALLRASHVVLTDSGGLQEEAPVLGRPLLVLRATTERPEVLRSGNALLVGTCPDRIVAETLRLLSDGDHHARMSRPAFLFGEPGASAAIADAVAAFLCERRLTEPAALLTRPGLPAQRAAPSSSG